VRLNLIPVELSEANAFVERLHRHHGNVVGHKFSLGVLKTVVRDVACIAPNQTVEELAGVAIVGRPVARGRDDGWTLEVTRLCTDGTRNACSFLYGAARRAAFALGYRRLGTYILASESGASLRASGWRLVGEVKGRSWSCPTRPRFDEHPLEDKQLFECVQDDIHEPS
jgi:hypothetical protein